MKAELLLTGTVAAACLFLAVPQVLRHFCRTHCPRTHADIRALGAAATQYAIEHDGRYPEGLEDLATGEPDGRACLPRVPSDPWGRSYPFVRPGFAQGLEIFTLGADGEVGGSGQDADVLLSELTQ